MSRWNDDQLLASIKQGAFQKVYLFYGPEHYMLMGCVSMLQSRAVGSQPLLNLVKLDGTKIAVERLEEEVEPLPVLSDYRCVCVADFDLEKLAKKPMDRFKAMVEQLPQTTILVLYYQQLALNPKKSAKLRNVFDFIDQQGAVVEFTVKTPAKLASILVARANKAGCTLSSQTARLLIERCGAELQPLLIELDKLISSAGSGEITQQLVEGLVVRALDSSVFDLSRAILARQSAKAFALLQDLFDQQQEPVALLPALAAAFLDLYRAKCLRLAGAPEKKLTAVYYRGREFRLRNAMREVPRYSLDQIKRCICLLYTSQTVPADLGQYHLFRHAQYQRTDSQKKGEQR